MASSLAQCIGGSAAYRFAQTALSFLDGLFEGEPLGAAELLLTAFRLAQVFQGTFVFLIVDVIDAVTQQVSRPRVAAMPMIGSAVVSALASEPDGDDVPGAGMAWDADDAESPRRSLADGRIC